MIVPSQVTATGKHTLSPRITCFDSGVLRPCRLRTALLSRYTGMNSGPEESARCWRYGELRCPCSNTYAKSAETSSKPWCAATAIRWNARSAAATGWPSGSRCLRRHRFAAAVRARRPPCPPWAAVAPPASKGSAAAADLCAEACHFMNHDQPIPVTPDRMRRSDSSNFNDHADCMRAAVRNDCIGGQRHWTQPDVRTMLLFANVAPCCASFRESMRNGPRRPSLAPWEPRSRLRPMDQNRNRE